jgi:integrase
MASTLGTKAQRLFKSLRKLPLLTEMDIIKIRELAENWLRETLEDSEWTRAVKGPVSSSQLEDELDLTKEIQADYQEALKERRHGIIQPQLDVYLQQEGVVIAKDSTDYKLLSREFLKSMVKLLGIELSRLQGDFSDEYYIAPPTQPVKKPSGPPLQEVVSAYLRHHEATWSASTRKKYPPIFLLLQEVVGTDLPITDLSHANLFDFKELVFRLPANRAKKPQYRDKSIHQLRNLDIPKEDIINDTNKRFYLATVKGFIAWAKANGFIKDDSIKSALEANLPKTRKSKREHFSSEELKLIFDPLSYPKDIDWKYWIPIIALYTGARLEEICSLYIKDIREINGVLCFDINSEGEKHTKTASSNRLIPIHPELVRLSFMDYVESLKSKGQERLFPELKWSKSLEKYSNQVSRWFGRHLEQLGIKSKSKQFHSFRNTFITACKHSGQDERKVHALTGHSSGSYSMSYDYYAGDYEIGLLAKVIQSVSFDLPDLRRS